MEKYNKIVAQNANVEMLHISLDLKKEPAEKWAVAGKFPWYTILFDDIEKSGLWSFNSTGGVPEYALVTSSGEKIGTGPEVFDQVKDLAK